MLEGARSEFHNFYKKTSSGKASEFLSKHGSGIKKGLFGYGIGMALGLPGRLEEGKSLPRAVAEQAAWSTRLFLAPSTIYGPLMAKGIASIPDRIRQAESNRDMQLNYRFMGGDYIDTQANYASRARAVEHIKRSRTSVQAGMGKEARRYHR